MSRPEFVYMAVIAATPEQVWEGLTTPEFTRQYWHKTQVMSDFQEGSSIEFVNEDGSIGVAGEILVANRPVELVYSWRFTGSESPAKDDPPSRVAFSLEAIGAGTRLTVTHDRLEANSQTATMVSFGWPHVLAGLKTLLETGKAVDFTGS